MDIEQFREYCLSKPLAEESLPFDEYTLVFKVAGKMFAVVPLEKPGIIILKCDPDKAIELREHNEAIQPAWHFNKRYWNSLDLNSGINDRLLISLTDHSYDEVVKKLPKKTKTNLGL